MGCTSTKPEGQGSLFDDDQTGKKQEKPNVERTEVTKIEAFRAEDYAPNPARSHPLPLEPKTDDTIKKKKKKKVNTELATRMEEFDDEVNPNQANQSLKKGNKMAPIVRKDIFVRDFQKESQNAELFVQLSRL
jgi:hypothetical protein